MTDSLNGIVNQLERQKTAIDHALAALRSIEGIDAPVPAPASLAPGKPRAARKVAQVVPASRQEVHTGKGKKRSAAVRKRMQEAQRLRWAKIRGESEQPAPAITEPTKPKRRISAEGMKRIIAATKKRWRLQKTAAKSA
jgi:hypothetical protein